MHQLAEDPLEVGEGILAVTPDLLDEGVNHRTAPAGLVVADEHPVLHAELGRADGVFGEVVVPLDLPVEEARLEVGPLAGGIGEGFAEQAAGRDLPPLPDVSDEAGETVVVPPRLEPADFLPLQRAGALFAESLFNPVDAGDLVEDPRDDARVVLPGLVERPADVGEAGDSDDLQFRMALDEGLVGAQAVALEVAAERRLAVLANEDGVQAGVGAAVVPVEEDAVFGVVIDPELAAAGLALAGLKAADGRFVDLDVGGGAEAGGDEVVKRPQAVGELVVPGAHQVAREFDAVGGLELPLLAVKGAVIAKLLGQQVGSERGSEHAAGEKAGFERRGDGDGVGVALEDVDEPLDDLHGEGGGLDVEALADLLADHPVIVRSGENGGVDDLAHDGGQPFEGVGELVGPGGARLGRSDRNRRLVSRRWSVGSSGGFGLFCLVLQEGQEELVVAHLLAPRAVKPLEQGGDDTLLRLQLGLEGVDFRGEQAVLLGESRDLLFGRFDGPKGSRPRAGPAFHYEIYRSSYHGRWSPSRRSMPSVSMASAVGLSTSLRRSPSMSCGQLNRPRSSFFATTQ